MRICILNGSPEAGDFDNYLDRLHSQLESAGHISDTYTLRDLSIRYCTGCFSCWVKTPGQCIFHDQSELICRAVIHSDLVCMASPITMGFVSALLKKSTDKLIPLLHPYLSIVQGEMHHRARYDHYPRWGLILRPNAGSDIEDIAIIQRCYSRAALNFKSDLAFTRLSTQPVEEVVYEINHL